MDLNKLIDVVLSEVNGKRAWEWVAHISQFNRIQASKGYHQAAELIIKELKLSGFKDVELFTSPADGKTKTWGNTPSFQWDIYSSELWIVDPVKEKLCDYQKTPLSVITHSKSCDIEAEVIDVGKEISLEDLKNIDVKGKIIMISGLVYLYYDILENSGAIGVIYYPDLERAGKELDKIIYNGLFTTQERMSKALFGFSISYKQAIRLKELMEKGPIKLHAKIESEFSEGNLEVVSTSIKGNEYPEEEIILIAHLCHPVACANDNASGSAGLLELACSFLRSIKNNLIKPPKRTLRFLWVPEIIGTLPWAKKNEDVIKKAVCCINLDMIGEHRNKIGNPLIIYKAPYSTPSILNDIVGFFTTLIADHPKGIAVNGSIAPLSFRLKAHDGGSDHSIFNDTHFGIPSIMLNHDDPYYHSSMDTIEFCDSSELQRVISIAACTAYTFANLDNDLITTFLPIIHEGFYNRMGKAIHILDRLVFEDIGNDVIDDQAKFDEKIALIYDLIKTFIEYESSVIESLFKFNHNLRDSRFLKYVEEEKNNWLNIQKQRCVTLLESNNNIISSLEKPELLYSSQYLKNYEGIITLRKLVQVSKKPIFKDFIKKIPYIFLGPIHELLNLLNKGFNVLRICSYLTLQYEQIIYPSTIQELIDYLEEQGFIKKR
ncbi:MAG: DUF4910 domain-containing protein [Promethearchaeota archaeon]|nr:MAG: DUF4910 domain-containing protein [Candidatus Lokiarchaeota archaeon]